MEQASNDSVKLKNRKVLFDHDGNPEDIVSQMMLLNMPQVELIGITVTPADCFIDDAIELTLKTLSLFDKKIPVAQGIIESTNPFPDQFRVTTIKANQLPVLILQEMDKSLLSKKPAHEFIVEILKETQELVTIMMTGPATNLAAAIELAPEIKSKIEEVVWMAGAVDVEGNVVKFDHDKSAEWNVYWDAVAGHKLFASGLNITIFPLDATNQVPLDKNFLKELAKGREYSITDIVGQMYAVTSLQSQAYMWDTLTVSYLGLEDFATFRKLELDVDTKRPSQGKTYKLPGSGQWVRIADKIKKEKVYHFFRDVLKFHGKAKQSEL